MPTPLPPTPALPRFADQSLLFSTEPIFDTDVSFSVDWLEPFTPKAGPSKPREATAAPVHAITSRHGHDASEHPADHFNVEEPVLSGLGEKQVGLDVLLRNDSKINAIAGPSVISRIADNPLARPKKSPRKHTHPASERTSVAPARPAHPLLPSAIASSSRLSRSGLVEGTRYSSEGKKRLSAETTERRHNRAALSETMENGQTERVRSSASQAPADKQKTVASSPVPTQEKSALSRYLAKAARDRLGPSKPMSQAGPTVSTSSKSIPRPPTTNVTIRPIASTSRSHGFPVPQPPVLDIGPSCQSGFYDIGNGTGHGIGGNDLLPAEIVASAAISASISIAHTVEPAAGDHGDTPNDDDDDEPEIRRARIIDDRMEEPIQPNKAVDDIDMLEEEADGGVDQHHNVVFDATEADRRITSTPPPTPSRAQKHGSAPRDGSASSQEPEPELPLATTSVGRSELEPPAEGIAGKCDQITSPLARSENKGKKRGRESLLDVVTGFLRRSTSSLSLRGESKEAEAQRGPATTVVADVLEVGTETRQPDDPASGTDPSAEERSPPRKVAKQSSGSHSTSMRHRPPISGHIPLARPVQPRPPRSDPSSRHQAEAPLRGTNTSDKPRLPLQPSRAHSATGNARPHLASDQMKHGSAAPTLKPPVPKAGVRSSGLTTSTSTSAFAAAALARLPPPGKGASAAAAPIRVKTPERARDLARRRSVFEAAALGPGATAQAPPRRLFTATTELAKTVPVRGHTPGKASRARAERREAFDAGVKARNDEKDRLRREEQRRREEEEEREYQRKRKETVIWARAVPDMYRRRGEGDGEAAGRA